MYSVKLSFDALVLINDCLIDLLSSFDHDGSVPGYSDDDYKLAIVLSSEISRVLKADNDHVISEAVV